MRCLNASVPSVALVTFTALKVNDESLAEDPTWTQTVFSLLHLSRDDGLHGEQNGCSRT
ncbi:hypothetical protein THF1C08_20181 [Vibrio jasicida]|uniref:Uncharacterized protein n=1 Tax=Vibrio jasicida TaxID=766224 RepID=A0AAU9QJN1_9VIBR|nr:hypothetical protein THF1C08_20181 [Vibrio jasicida]CAH1585435.1 hypothetical protein THF1A12_20183 [Vibrio jasicida]